jgi:glutathione-regulated potassium-efflux system ancillary protein KefC
MMLDALIYLAAGVLFVPLARRAGLGSVLGYLIAGVVIGPYAVGLVKDVESIMHFSEFGVVLMLFLIGLELDPKRLWSMRRDVFGGGALQLAVCGGALWACALVAGLDVAAGGVSGLALALSSTAIAVQTMAERNLLSLPTGRSAFAVLLFQDIAAIPLLAVIPLLAPAAVQTSTPVWLDALAGFGAIAGIVIVGRYLTRPALRLMASTGLREIFTAFALLIVIGISQLMSLVGLSMALGAFLAGVLLASSEYRRAIEVDIEPFKGLLLGLFFISVGMSIDLRLLITRPGDVAAMVGSFLLVKMLMLWLVGRVVGITARQRWLFAILLSQGGEFGFVVFTIARGSGLLSREWEALLTISVALSMAATPLLLLMHDLLLGRRAARRQRAADTIEEPQGPVIIAGFGRFGQIVGRLLFANGFRATVLDHDPDQIELLRKLGYKVFYGDATRLDLLTAAGASQAKLLINAIDDVDENLALTDLVRDQFPALPILCRARNVAHFVELRARGVSVVERETFESALRIGRHALEALGLDRFRAREVADTFRRHNTSTLEALVPHFHDEARMLSQAKAGREEFEELFARDRARFEDERGRATWD